MGNASPHRNDLPQARVVTPGGRSWQPTVSVRDRAHAIVEPLRPRFHAFLHVVIGLWPLIAVALLAAVFLWSAGYEQP